MVSFYVSFVSNILRGYMSILTAGIYIFKVINGNSRKICEICSKLTIRTSERRHWQGSDLFIVNFEQMSYSALVFPWCFQYYFWISKCFLGFFFQRGGTFYTSCIVWFCYLFTFSKYFLFFSIRVFFNIYLQLAVQ